MSKQIKILFLTNVPSPYRVHFFNILGTKCDLTVLYQKKSSTERNNQWVAEKVNKYKSIFLRGINTGVDNALCFEVIKYLNKNYDAIIICGNASPTEILAIEWCKLRKIKYFLEADGAFINPKKGVKEKLKKHLIRGGELFFSTCIEHDKYYEYYGANQSKIVRYHFSSLFKKDILNQVVSKKEKNILRNKLKMKEKKIVLAVGQFIYRKGFDLLLKSATQLPDDVGIYIIGDAATEEYISFIHENGLKNIHFEGFKTKLELEKYYKAADVFVLPTREDIWGLVINEAMAYGLPVITTERCNAGLELIKNGENGYVIPVDNYTELTDKIIKTLENSNKMGEKSLAVIKNYTIENMVMDHIRILKENL